LSYFEDEDFSVTSFTGGNRDQLILATKFSFHYKADTGPEKTPANNNYWGNHKRSMNVSLRDSLAKLQTDWVDIYYVHYWDYTTSIEEVMDSLQLLVQQGKVLYLGISDTPAWVVAGANHYAKAHGKTPFSIYQGQWNVLLRDFEREILPMVIHFGMAVAPWGSLGQGKFRRPEEIAENKSNGEVQRFTMEQTEAEKAMSAALAKVANAHGLKSLTAVALAYVRSKAPNVFPLVGGRKIEHLKDNIKGLEITLTQSEIEFLESQKEFDVGFPGTFIGQDWRLTGKPSIALISQGPITVGG
jgi:aryl-alcohol dehydrogenase-like predicted oxidoreductase